MKLKVLPERGEMRDYFDLKEIEQRTDHTVEDGLGLFLARYGHRRSEHLLGPIVRALGYLDDVDDDHLLPEGRDTIAAYWARRQPAITRSLGRRLASPPAVASNPPAGGMPPGDGASITSGHAGRTWVKSYRRRDGRVVRGHHRG